MIEWQIRRPEQQRPQQRLHDYAYERERNLVAQRNLRERLRYKQYVRRGTISHFMQRLGDLGRRWFPWIGYGWDGIGPRHHE